MTTSTLADNAISLTDLIGKLAGVGQTVERARPILHILAQYAPIPYLAQIDNVLELVAPYFDKVAAAAPILHNALDSSGRPVLDAIQAHGPDLMDAIKNVYAISVNHDPARPETNLTAADIPDDIALAYGAVVFTPGRTNNEQQREWDRAQGVS